MRVRAGSEDGQISVLIVGYVCVALMMILVAASASSVHLQRKQLLGLADAAALAAASAATQQSYLDEGVAPGQSVPLTDDSVREEAENYLRLARPRLPVRVVAPTGAPGGRVAEVSLRTRADLPFVGWVLRGWRTGITIEVTSRADVELS